jgi:hypothetical protein
VFKVKLSGREVKLDSLSELTETEAVQGAHFALVYPRRSGLVGVVFLSSLGGDRFRATYGPVGFPLRKWDDLSVSDLEDLLERS